MAVRLFNTMLQQAGRSAKKTIATDLKRQADDMNVAGRVNDGGRVVFAVDHNKYMASYFNGHFFLVAFI